MAARVFCLPPLATALICAPAYALIFWVLACGKSDTPVAYFAYLFSAYALALTCTALYRTARALILLHILPWLCRRVPLLKRLLQDGHFRSEALILGGLLFNLAYAALNLYYGLRDKSLWFVTLAGYNALLFAMRAALLRLFHSGGASPAAELRRVRLCGWLLFVMNFFMTGIVIHIVYNNRGFTYNGNRIYIMALYAFYAVSHAVVQWVRFGRRGSILLAETKALNFVAALVSMLTLETAMIAEFSDDDEIFRRNMTGISGTVVCVFVFVLAVCTIASTTNKLHRLEQ